VLGGQRLTSDYEVEVGVPVLSKIPVVNRFFTNRINNKTEQTLLMMLRPEILIQQETEDVLFPGLRNQLNGANGDAGM
jgi:type II secretory pathway component GspD/PulD (secretin)